MQMLQIGFAVGHCIFIGVCMTAVLHEGKTPAWIESFGHYNAYACFILAWGMAFSVLVQIDKVSDSLLTVLVKLAAAAMCLSVSRQASPNKWTSVTKRADKCPPTR